jgi:hypothetical protein
MVLKLTGGLTQHSEGSINEKKKSISPDKVYSDDLNKLPSLQNYIQAHTIIFMVKSFWGNDAV